MKKRKLSSYQHIDEGDDILAGIAGFVRPLQIRNFVVLRIVMPYAIFTES